MLDCLFSSLATHPTTWALGTAYVLTAAVNSLPEPGTNLPAGQLFYNWMFHFLHVLSNRVVQKYPQSQTTQPQQFVHTFVPTQPPLEVGK